MPALQAARSRGPNCPQPWGPPGTPIFVPVSSVSTPGIPVSMSVDSQVSASSTVFAAPLSNSAVSSPVTVTSAPASSFIVPSATTVAVVSCLFPRLYHHLRHLFPFLLLCLAFSSRPPRISSGDYKKLIRLVVPKVKLVKKQCLALVKTHKLNVSADECACITLSVFFW